MKNVIKGFILSAIFFTLCAPAIGGTAFSGDISVGSAEVAPGHQVIIPVYLSGNDIDIMALTVPLQYNSADLSVDSVSFIGTLIKPGMSPLVQIDNPNQFVKFTYAPTSGLPLINEESGLLASIYFSVEVSSPDQTVSIDSVYRLEYVGPPQLWTRVEVADSSGTSIFFPTFTAGYVEVKTHTGADDGGLVLPMALELKQNFPNPFNPATTISFSLPERSHVTLKVYNILGQEAETLIDDVLNPGEHDIVWNACNKASGVYFYRLAYKNRVLTKKMALLK